MSVVTLILPTNITYIPLLHNLHFRKHYVRNQTCYFSNSLLYRNIEKLELRVLLQPTSRKSNTMMSTYELTHANMRRFKADLPCTHKLCEAVTVHSRCLQSSTLLCTAHIYGVVHPWTKLDLKAYWISLHSRCKLISMVNPYLQPRLTPYSQVAVHNNSTMLLRQIFELFFS